VLFNSPTFILFFVVVLSAYWLLRSSLRAQNRLLLLASYFFYGVWSWKFLLLLWLSTLLDYTCGRLIGAAQDPRRRRALVIVSAVANLTFLGIFKYAGFFVRETAELLTALGFQPHFRVLQFVLPVGISFYTFQSLSYVIDVYRRKLAPVRRLEDYALFVAFWPQLVAGPIERATRLVPQLTQPRKFSAVALESGIQLMLWGLFKKIVIADNLAPYVNAVFQDPASYSGLALAQGVLFFAFQIYCDFSGYSDTARGAARTLGIEIMANFDLPYFSRNPVEFWRRWHISLSQWFQDYLYYPLAMHYLRKGGFASRYKAHIVSMTLIGLWHGANWTFVAFGLYWGVLLAGYLFIKESVSSSSEPRPRSPFSGWVSGTSSAVLMFAIACGGWLLFRAESIQQAVYMASHLFSTAGARTVTRPDTLPEWMLWTLVCGLWLAEWISRNPTRLVAALASPGLPRLALRHAMVASILLSYLVAQQSRSLPFIYFAF